MVREVFRALGLGFRDQGLGFRDQGLGLRVSGREDGSFDTRWAIRLE